jgi:tetratricopeptide (TPR) repeat protein
MKKIIFTITILFVVALTGCEKFTDIEPKGRNLLSSTGDLNLLLNDTYPMPSVVRTTSLISAISSVNIPQTLNETSRSWNHIVVFWDEDRERRIDLRQSCDMYENIYRIVGRVANPVIARSSQVTGPRDLADRYKAEALVLRAWFQYLAVNLFAKAYDPATAATDGGVPYVFETDLLSVPQTKYTVAQVYEFILADLDEALKRDALPDEAVNKQRIGKQMAYAVQAQVLLSMRRYSEALAAARSSLAISNHINDFNTMLQPYEVQGATVTAWTRFAPPTFHKEDIFFTSTQLILNWFPPEVLGVFDLNSVIFNYMPTLANLKRQGANIVSGASEHRLPDEFDVLTTPGNTQNAVSGAGLTTVDMLFIEAECLLQTNLTEAREKIDHIRKHRILSGEYVALPGSATKTELHEALRQFWRMENMITYKDFINVKRWNTYPEYRTDLKRTIMGTTRTLRWDSPLWIYPFPKNATDFNTGLTQNF